MRRSTGEGYLVALRPERIRICAAGEEPDLGPVTVAATAYKGRDVEIEATLPDGQSLKFLIPADQQLGAAGRRRRHQPCLATAASHPRGGNRHGRIVIANNPDRKEGSAMTTENGLEQFEPRSR